VKNPRAERKNGYIGERKKSRNAAIETHWGQISTTCKNVDKIEDPKEKKSKERRGRG
jgi:hypothetical protein